MNEKIIIIIHSILLILLIIISGFFFSLTNIRLENFLTINIFPTFNLLITINFFIFLIMVSITLAIINLIIKKFQSKTAIILITTSYFIGIILVSIIFNLLEYLIPLMFGTIGIFFATKTQNQKEKEYKTMPILRSGIASTGKIILLIAIGTLIFTTFITFTNQEQLETNFTKDFLEITIGEQDNLQNTITEPIIDSIIDSQKQTIILIKNLEGYSELRTKNDLDTLTFVMGLEAIENAINSKEYKENIQEQFKKNQETIDLGENVLGNIPIIDDLAKFSWIMYPTTLFLIILMIGNLIIKNLSGIIYSIIMLYQKKEDL